MDNSNSMRIHMKTLVVMSATLFHIYKCACVLKLFLQNLLSRFDEINASIEDVQLLCEREVLLSDSDDVRQQVCY